MSEDNSSPAHTIEFAAQESQPRLSEGFIAYTRSLLEAGKGVKDGRSGDGVLGCRYSNGQIVR
jgi:hypothetical protein